MQRPWDRGGCQRQHIDIFTHFFNFFFMRHTETLLLIYDQQTKVFISYIL